VPARPSGKGRLVERQGFTEDDGNLNVWEWK